MEFIGQKTVVTELDYLLEDIQKGNNYNILLRAPSGFGKTTLGLICLNRLGLKDSVYYIPNEEGIIPLDSIRNKRFHLIDEVHVLKTPEVLYPFMDSGRFTFILASNESGSLKEPLINRCISFIFEPYTEAELLYMAQRYLNNPNIPMYFVEEVSRRCKRNPRILKVLCTRISYILKNYRITNDDDYMNILENILKVRAGGLDLHDELYLNFLKGIGGRASLNVISSGTGLDKNLILSEIEPGLIYLGRIKITSKGRELC